METRLPNKWGFYDMSGNVAELCFNRFGPFPGGEIVDPRGPTGGTNARVARNGSAILRERYQDFVYRCECWPEKKEPFLGFRIALAPEL